MSRRGPCCALCSVCCVRPDDAFWIAARGGSVIRGPEFARVRVIRSWFAVEEGEHDSLSPKGSSPLRGGSAGACVKPGDGVCGSYAA